MSIYLAVFVVVTYFIWIKCFHNRHRRTLQKSLKTVLEVPSLSEIKGDGIRALIITAHPDDECMFFAPTILQLVELDAIVHLLCLSEGNYYNQGAQRKQELFNSCAVLGIQHSRITIVDHKNLPDDPKAEWRVSLVSSIIVKHMRAHTFNMVLTFDGRGVSGHANHIAIYKTVRLCFAVPGDRWPPQEVHLLPRASPQLFAAIMSLLFFRRTGLQNAMLCHRTQLLWFRYLYIAFSRYMFTNTFQIIPQGPKNLKIY
ncbi:N-acetylglucosaminyl-phosphatidylinositol de-N-acetylase isoform X4 [Antennarius striatus]|uniref:N-acetylglucosaminyl-phosphatidylinositol de-N-acetylase isoform X4 n=1 Tax=Antennarius striatus TaxID=241820 RepID=UPI0035AE77C9